MAEAKFFPITPPSANTDPLVAGLFGDGTATDIGGMLNTAFIVAINVGAILAMMRIMWAGWLYMGSADMWSNKHHAKEVFQNSIIGLLILLAIWIILRQINPCILEISFLDGNPSSQCRTPTQTRASTPTQKTSSAPLAPNSNAFITGAGGGPSLDGASVSGNGAEIAAP